MGRVIIWSFGKEEDNGATFTPENLHDSTQGGIRTLVNYV